MSTSRASPARASTPSKSLGAPVSGRALSRSPLWSVRSAVSVMTGPSSLQMRRLHADGDPVYNLGHTRSRPGGPLCFLALSVRAHCAVQSDLAIARLDRNALGIELGATQQCV